MRCTVHWLAAFTLGCVLALSGCAPAGSSILDEQKEPHFLEGKSRVSSMDYKAAEESFEQALEVNPHSASAHFELACLLVDHDPDPAAAIYHYDTYLKLRPEADNADIVKQRIQVLKQDLVKSVTPPSATPALQREFDRLADENRQLRDEVQKWRAYYAHQAAAPVTNAVVAVPVAATPAVTPVSRPTPVSPTPTPTPTTPAASKRTYKVQPGDTPAAIARKYSIRLDALLSANPGLDPKHMRVGQTLNLPGQ